jgi:hypothetical protein
MTARVKVEFRPGHDRPGPPAPACVRIRGARCLCSECGDYVTVAHIVRGERKAFCGHCCPVCRPGPPLAGGGDQHAA